MFLKQTSCPNTLLLKTTELIHTGPVLKTYLHFSYLNVYIVFCGAATLRELWPSHSWGFQITNNEAPHSVGFLWTSDQPDAETSTWPHTAQQKNTHGPGGIQTLNLSMRASADLRLRMRGRGNQQNLRAMIYNLLLLRYN